MRLNFALVSSFLLASAVLADRRSLHRRSQSLNRLQYRTDTASDRRKHLFHQDIAGVLLDDTALQVFTSIGGEFIVPPFKGADNSSASMVFFIDGGACTTRRSSLVVTVVGLISDNVTSYFAGSTFGELEYNFDNFPVAAGDHLRLSAEVSSPALTSGSVTIENVKTGKTAKHDFKSKTPLCPGSAGWTIVPDGPLADFGTVAFTNAKTAGPGGVYTPSNGPDSLILDMNQTSTTVDGSSITIHYV